MPDSVASRTRLKYTLIGAGAGALVGAAAGALAVWAKGGQGCARACRPNDEASYIVLGTAVGAVAGAGIGFIIGNHRAGFALRW
jgi:hypothetical protein